MQVVAIAGTAFFSAAATRGGLLHTWRPGGNLLLPPLALGCPAARLEAQGDWGLLLAGVDGELALLDMQRVSAARHLPALLWTAVLLLLCCYCDRCCATAVMVV